MRQIRQSEKGNVYKLKNLDKDEYVSYVDWSQFPNINVDKWETHEDGTITLNTMLQAGHYQLEEIDCSNGYLLNKEPLKFELKKIWIMTLPKMESHQL